MNGMVKDLYYNVFILKNKIDSICHDRLHPKEFMPTGGKRRDGDMTIEEYFRNLSGEDVLSNRTIRLVI